ncbi:aconitate hydratase A [Thermocladium modestius]|uniref:aconitate hydratase n=1 Tax=Thermocladium modestius TaxID=62609 RepID=A0A830GSG7_9CREN|nr:aconitate hydratase AcnA [Thermocladium modestius]GGP19149.1 aconitate hydratase A [Thermocladium modestius]
MFDTSLVKQKMDVHPRPTIWSINALEKEGLAKVSKLPITIKILLENMLRNYDGKVVTEEDVMAVANWSPSGSDKELPYKPARVIMQDFTGVPLVADLAAMRDAVKRLGSDPGRVNPIVPSELVIDHSVQVDYFGTGYALDMNMEKEMERNRERYMFLKWAQSAFNNMRIVPPGRGIIHQVNMEYLARVVFVSDTGSGPIAYPDTVIGTDSHTTMISGIGVLGWGVGGIEAEAVMLGQPHYIQVPQVVGVKLTGELQEGVTATDLALTITELLRKRGVVGKIVEFYGPGLKYLPTWDRATVANMAPEYGATTGYFPVDEDTMKYLALTGRDEASLKLVEQYLKVQGMFHTGDEEPNYSEVIEVNLDKVEPSIAGPRNPEERIPLKKAKQAMTELILSFSKEKKEVPVEINGTTSTLTHGSLIIAAITSCTNTSNPTVMLGAGLVAKKAVERGLRARPYVKTSLAPGSTVVTEYLKNSGLLPYLEALNFHVTGYGCTVCIGNTGPIPEPVAKAVRDGNLYATAVLSGNRNFEGRIHPLARGAFLASPMLVVVYALAGRMDIDLYNEPIGIDPNGRPVYMRDIWPTMAEIKEAIQNALVPELFKEKYSDVFRGNQLWEQLKAPSGELYAWDPSSTYIRKPPFFDDVSLEPSKVSSIKGARVLLLLGDRITTDHISPANAIPIDSPAGKYLLANGVKPEDFNTYGSRRGNHEVMMRGGFSNVRLRNLLVDREGGWTVYLPTGEVMSVYDAAMKYKEQGIPLIILAGKQYGTGSSRDWAAKATYLLGVKAVIAESFERIHRSNLVDMGVLPLQFKDGQGWKSLGLTGKEVFDILGIEDISPHKELTVRATGPDGKVIEFNVIARLDTEVEVEYYRHGGILPFVMRKIISSS